MLMSHLSHRMIECTQDLTHRAVQDGTQANHAATAVYVVARVQTKRVRFRAANDSSLVPEGFDVVPTTHVEFTVGESSRHGAPMTLVRSVQAI